MKNEKNNQSKELGLKLLKDMYLSKKFEEKVQHYFSLGMIHGTTHLSIGEEGAAAGTCEGLEAQDLMYATHRGHSQAICKGIDINLMMAEIFGKATGVCKGKGGSMHIADKDKGVLGANGIVGAALPLACGSAFAAKRRKQDVVTVAFFGDGAANEGACHEAMNLASAWDLPVLFVCTNNTYGMSTHISKVMKDTDIAKRAIPYGMPAETVDGNDAFAVYECIKRARDYVAKNGPMLIVENTYRISGHSKSDGNLYRTKDEINAWKARNPIDKMRNDLLAAKTCTVDELDAVDKETTELIDKAVQFALDSPYPELNDVYNDVYAL
ncbi:thiamine pyrophosphate-dependent dehydrogenase E1 component subunit alpha [Acetobacterium wieringae]|uniref:Thiamine pyrophosphate-dependent dehydrogenase E1 component subunit alpha n=1 Tax=Acetobacterium wieringae TaxID=52694 RepID=A0ABY6HIQ9_9FIRM|nr:thiamine pyrophosphate-dependent dehydrogenase E1 component subunit alpha [Acetobacterium wieringae]UYO63448.1 thiamine pyrophosphate-dependent dehydrogenase E1 component subunit alpha [Acetobacterium wieringae]VUZ27158.1 Acetoin:2,6-dichlorophenolindophenol oxidoreductase subunit alpha [Acetobacterium wieringae]